MTMRVSNFGKICIRILDDLPVSHVHAKSVSCFSCARRNNGYPTSRQWHHNTFRTFTSSRISSASKKDYYKEEKLPIFDYGKVHPEKKRLYVFGQAGSGALGLTKIMESKHPGHDRRKFVCMHRPVRHAFAGDHQVRDVAAGHGFTLISVKPKKENGPVIFGCGYNAKSQLGYQANHKDEPMMVLISFVPLALPIDQSSVVLAIGAGRGHSMISVAGKGLITFGDNAQGQCGRKIIDDEEYMGSKYICRLPPFGSSHDYDVVQIANNLDVSTCLTRMGRIYTFGANNQGQLGRGKNISKPWVPAEVGGDLKDTTVKKVVTSGASSIAISDKGELFGWGSNDCGQINPDTYSNVYYEPVHIKIPRRIGKIVDAAIGDMFTFVLNERGDVYVWGTGGSLGLGPKNVVVKTPTIMPPPLFGRNEFSPDISVVKVVSSFKYAAAVNSIGDLYTWGYNDHGCLGLGNLHPPDTGYQFFPMKVTLSSPVHKVCLGVDHTVVMTKGGY